MHANNQSAGLPAGLLEKPLVSVCGDKKYDLQFVTQ